MDETTTISGRPDATLPLTGEERLIMDEVGPGARTVDAPLSAIAAYVATVIPAGEDGEDGEDGTDGREVELQKSATHVQWRYVGDTTWTDIVPLSEITGVNGAPGADGNGTAYYGQIGRQASGTVDVSASGTYYPIDLVGTLDADNSYGLIEGTSEDLALKNDTGQAQLLIVVGSADVRSSNNEVLGMRLAVNGVTIAASECRVTTGSTNYGKLLSQWIIELDDGDEVSMHVANQGHTTDITVERAKLVALTPGRQGEQGDKGDVGPTPTLQPNHVFAGPVSGSPAPAAGRPLIGADLPVIADGIVFTISNRGEIATPSTNYDESLPLSLPSTVAKITFTTHIDNTGSATTTLNAYKRTPAGAKTSLLSANATLAPGASVAVASLSTTPGVLSLAVGDRVGVDLIGLGTDASGIKCIVELTRPAV